MASKKQISKLQTKHLSIAFDSFLETNERMDTHFKKIAVFDGLYNHIFKRKRKPNKANRKFIDRHVENENRKSPF